MIRYLDVLLALAVVSISPGAFAQGADGGSDACAKDFIRLREDTEMKGKVIKAAADRHASPGEACKLIGDYRQAEVRMLEYVEANAERCGTPAELADRLKAGHRTTEALLKKVCSLAQQAQTPQKGPVGDFDHLIGRPSP